MSADKYFAYASAALTGKWNPPSVMRVHEIATGEVTTMSVPNDAPIMSALQSSGGLLILRATRLQNAVFRRISELMELALEDEIEMSPSSFWDLRLFISARAAVSVPNVFALDNGNFRAVWKNSQGERVALEFQGSQTVEFVIFEYDHLTRQDDENDRNTRTEPNPSPNNGCLRRSFVNAMNGQSIPNADHVLRHVNGRLIQGEDIDGSGFRLRENETNLSFNWMEYYRNHSPDEQIPQLIRDTFPLKLKKKDKFVKLNVGSAKSHVNGEHPRKNRRLP